MDGEAVGQRRENGLSPSRKKLPDNETKDQTMPGFGGELREGEAGTQRRGGTCDGRTPQDLTGT